MSVVLLYNIKDKKAIDIKMICHKLKVPFKSVEKTQYGLTIGEIVENSTLNRILTQDFTEEMMLFANVPNSVLDKILTQLKKKKATVALKAVLTETNSSFNSYELFKELSAEHKAMEQGSSVHS